MTSVIVNGVKLGFLVLVLLAFLIRRIHTNPKHTTKMMTTYYILACVGLCFLMVAPCAIVAQDLPYANNSQFIEICNAIGFALCYASLILFLIFLMHCTLGHGDVIDAKLRCCVTLLRWLLLFVSCVALAMREILGLAALATNTKSDVWTYSKRAFHVMLLTSLFMAALLLFVVLKQERALATPFEQYCMQLWLNVFTTLFDLVIYIYAKFVPDAAAEWTDVLDFLVCAPVLLNSVLMRDYDPDEERKKTALADFVKACIANKGDNMLSAIVPADGPELLLPDARAQQLGLNH